MEYTFYNWTKIDRDRIIDEIIESIEMDLSINENHEQEDNYVIIGIINCGDIFQLFYFCKYLTIRGTWIIESRSKFTISFIFSQRHSERERDLARSKFTCNPSAV